MVEKKEILWITSRHIRDLDEHQISLKGHIFIHFSLKVCLLEDRQGYFAHLIYNIPVSTFASHAQPTYNILV